jgi:cellulose synthase/poly-beta-1,6-N-acetylglucosamine synthase-like glycosyltransferase/phosphoglycerol transferase MdoB-like AlkP superfamily enzyme
MSAFEIFCAILTYGILLYSLVLLVFYLGIGVYSVGETRRYLHKNSFTDYRMLASSTHTPSVSVLAPAYNEGSTIIENVRSLLSIFYSNLEVIIINDGSKDDTMQKLIDAYDLEKVDFYVQYKIPAKEVRGIYKSKSSVYKKLLVVDKVNGGKADALNVGVNVASNDYILCIDVDCILEQDAILKMVKPFLEDTGARVIASGGVVRIANSCIIEDGRLVKVRLPKQYLPRMQTLEYIRAFLLGRMAWARINGLLLISGAFGAFDKEIVIKCGGYDHSTVGEDMELVVRMRRYMEENKLPYKVKYIPDPLCWTEAPADYEILGRQRNRWMRGTIETMLFHKKMFMNPKYGLLGMLSYPYWFFYEMIAPLIEFLGMIVFFVLAWFGLVAWAMFFKLLFFIICFGYVYSAFAVYMEVSTYHQYKRRSDVMILLLTALTEPFTFHPFVVWSSIKGYIDYFRKKKSWGEMTRQGFAQPAQQAVVNTTPAPVTPGSGEQPIAPVIVEPIKTQQEKRKIAFNEMWARFAEALKVYSGQFLTALLLMLLLRAIEMLLNINAHGVQVSFWKSVQFGLLQDLVFLFSVGLWMFLPFAFLYSLQRMTAKVVSVFFWVIIVFIQLVLVQYFTSTLNLLGADAWSYTWTDIKQTVGASSVLSFKTLSVIVLFLAAVIATFIFIPKRIRLRLPQAIMLFLLILVFAALNLSSKTKEFDTGDEYGNNLAVNKSQFFYQAALEKFYPNNNETDIYAAGYFYDASLESIRNFKFIDKKNYPFAHTDTAEDVLSPFFNPTNTKPNIVFIIVEGLGRAYSGDQSYLGSFTPFLDSLSKQSLYWPNFLSAGGRTFAVMPSIFSSVPFGKSGFAELGDQMPDHVSLLNVLKHNGYQTGFFYSGNSSFDNLKGYMRKNNVERIADENNFPSGYRKMPTNDQGFTWGYGDKELYRFMLAQQQNTEIPYCNVLLTVSTHDPFKLNEQSVYLAKFRERMNTLKLSAEEKTEHTRYQNQFATVLYADDAIKELMTAYSKRPDFTNTIFVITGDHRMPEIPISNKMDRYHVPFIVYSPLLKKAATFNSISTHLDITPTFVSFLRNYAQIKTPSINNWIGKGIDTIGSFANTHNYALKQTKANLVDYIEGRFWLSEDQLFEIQADMSLTKVTDDPKKAAEMKAHFQLLKQRSEQVITRSLIPDSVFRRFNQF